MASLIINEGTRFGHLTYVRDAKRKLLPSGQKPRVARCKCDCGRFKNVLLLHLVRGRITSCGCDKYKILSRKSVIGMKYGTITIIKELNDLIVNNIKFRMVEGVCVCGLKWEGRLNNLRKMKGCGCKTCGLIRKSNIKHGLTKHPLFGHWQNMKNRCTNPNVESYKYYGKKGIKVCKEWLHDYFSFYNWSIQNGYKKGLSLDRYPNKMGHYSPSNCRWATDKQQQNNKLSNVYYTYKGETKTLSEFADQYGFNYKRANARIKKLKWSIDKAIEEACIPPSISLKRDYIPKR